MSTKSQILFSAASAGSVIGLLSASNHLMGSVVSSGAAMPALGKNRFQANNSFTIVIIRQDSLSSESPISAISLALC